MGNSLNELFVCNYCGESISKQMDEVDRWKRHLILTKKAINDALSYLEKIGMQKEK